MQEYSRWLAREYPPELWREPGLIESTVIIIENLGFNIAANHWWLKHSPHSVSKLLTCFSCFWTSIIEIQVLKGRIALSQAYCTATPSNNTCSCILQWFWITLSHVCIYSRQKQDIVTSSMTPQAILFTAVSQLWLWKANFTNFDKISRTPSLATQILEKKFWEEINQKWSLEKEVLHVHALSL